MCIENITLTCLMLLLPGSGYFMLRSVTTPYNPKSIKKLCINTVGIWTLCYILYAVYSVIFIIFPLKPQL